MMCSLEQLLATITDQPRAFRRRNGQIEWIALRDWPIKGWQTLNDEAEDEA